MFSPIKPCPFDENEGDMVFLLEKAGLICLPSIQTHDYYDIIKDKFKL